MFGLTVDKLIVIAIIAAIIIGPERLPLYAEKLATLVKTVRGFLDTAKSRAVEELGPDFDPAEWKKLDPRQYDPRRIVQDALAEDAAAEPAAAEPIAAEPISGSRPEASARPQKPAAPAAPAAAGWQTALLARVGTGQTPTESPPRAAEL